jgi:hypothetical protein
MTVADPAPPLGGGNRSFGARLHDEEIVSSALGFGEWCGGHSDSDCAITLNADQRASGKDEFDCPNRRRCLLLEPRSGMPEANWPVPMILFFGGLP